MTLSIPGIALALSLLFLLQRERPGLTLRSAAQILGGGATACAATLFWVQLRDGTDVARYLGLILGIFIAAFCMATFTRMDLRSSRSSISCHWRILADLSDLAMQLDRLPCRNSCGKNRCRGVGALGGGTSR
jgi:hypothetical protein